MKSMPKGQFIVMKTGTHPMISRLKLYFRWGIEFGEPFRIEDRGARAVSYMERDGLIREVELKYPQKKKSPLPEPEEEYDAKSPKSRRLLKTGGM